jgi:hypothetical protein
VRFGQSLDFFDRAAVQALTFQLDRAAAVALQRSLVPAGLPALSGLEMAARYVPGTGNAGGDWYDVFCVPTGEVFAVIGDVAGSGLQAAVIMGRMRSALLCLYTDGLVERRGRAIDEGIARLCAAIAARDPGQASPSRVPLPEAQDAGSGGSGPADSATQSTISFAPIAAAMQNAGTLATT